MRNGQVGAVDQVLNQHADDAAEFVRLEAPESVIDTRRRYFAAPSHRCLRTEFSMAICGVD